MNAKLRKLMKETSNYLELAQLPDGSIVLRRSDDHDNPIVRIEFSNESKDFLQGQELTVAKEMIRAGIESVSGNVSDLDDFFDKQREKFSKKQNIVH
jgi:hypothetical protein|tara:strand:+ start:771 stop:1061 length:291 start_codon:yes stop_codon:yes gene_type:complete